MIQLTYEVEVLSDGSEAFNVVMSDICNGTNFGNVELRAVGQLAALDLIQALRSAIDKYTCDEVTAKEVW